MLKRQPQLLCPRYGPADRTAIGLRRDRRLVASSSDWCVSREPKEACCRSPMAVLGPRRITGLKSMAWQLHRQLAGWIRHGILLIASLSLLHGLIFLCTHQQGGSRDPVLFGHLAGCRSRIPVARLAYDQAILTAFSRMLTSVVYAITYWYSWTAVFRLVQRSMDVGWLRL